LVEELAQELAQRSLALQSVEELVQESVEELAKEW
jgi:hypothetical protein